MLTAQERYDILQANYSGIYQIVVTGDTEEEIRDKIKAIEKLVSELNNG